MKDEKSMVKVSTKIWRPVLDKFDKKIEAACLRRDAYLSKLLETELECLDSEVGIPNSRDAHDFIAAKLDLLDRKLVSLSLPPEQVGRLNEICRIKRIPRDAFFNRLFLLLASSPKAINHLMFLGESSWAADVRSRFDLSDGLYPLGDVSINPFWAIREGFNILRESEAMIEYREPETGNVIKVIKDTPDGYLLPSSVYTTMFDDRKISSSDLYGVNCYIADQHVPGHPADAARRKTLDEIFAEL